MARMSSLLFAGALSIALCVCVGSPVPGDCLDGQLILPPSPPASHLPGSGDGSGEISKLTPDYLAGPWKLLDKEHPFQAWTQRPRMMKILNLLSTVADTIAQADHSANTTREASLPEEQAIIEEGNHIIKTMAADIALVDERRKAYENIKATQDTIDDKVNKDLVPKLLEISRLYQTSAELRFPFAERLAAFTDDLMKLLRAKIDAQIRLKGFVPKDELRDTLTRYDSMGADIQHKIEEEVTAASRVLNPTSKAIHNARNAIDQTEREIKELREKLVQYMAFGGSYVNGESQVKHFALENEQQLVDAVTRAGQEEDKLIAYNTAQQGPSQSFIHHAAVLTSALMQNDQSDQPASESLQAMQTVTPVDPLE